MPQQIYLVEDHPVVRGGLSSLIEPEPNLTISGETSSARDARRALDDGTQGYLMKSNATEKVVEAIRHVLDGNVYLSAEMTSAIVPEHVGGGEPDDVSPLDALTDRELEVLMLLGEGHERCEIAEALALSQNHRHLQKSPQDEALTRHERRPPAVRGGVAASSEQPPE